MADIINKGRIRQRSVVITLLDLKNAFGEVHHNLIQSVLDYHHIPEHIKFVIKSLYTDFQTSIIISEFRAPFISVGRGVLQGDCLSPLLSNMCFNTFIQHIKAEKYRQFGLSIKLLNPIHLFQFADDAAVIAGQESENQHLLNRFSIWCQWSNMIIRVDKCSTFGIKKAITKSVQYLPKLLINNNMIPTIKIGGAFQYLGLYFDFKMSNNNHNTELTTLVNEPMTDIDSKPLHPRNKLLVYSLLRKALKLSPNQSINEQWKSTNTHTNIQYDFYNSTKEVLKDFRSEHDDKLKNQLTCQGFFFSNLTKLSHLNKVWSTAQSKLPKNIYNFTIRYINNSLPTRKNLNRWGLSSSSECSFCLGPESLLHVVAGCQCHLDRFTRRHNSILNFLANTLQIVNGSALYADVPGFKSPSIITGDTYRPDLLLSLSNGSFHVVELTVGYETNLENNVKRKKSKYRELVRQLDENFNEVNFVNLSMSSLGIFAQECSTFLEMLGNVGLDINYQTYCVRKMMIIAIRSTYYIFCCRNKEWESPDLLTI
ncbi:Hypothetical predicted protein [Paramuricea clavata]|uniref:Uncharacterized protein n=1 Tax=Paramuricea clavata TaxID=317549 RepID=A0A7D9IHT8_PARCT|nr:Hypothetical predicted protein [Paramuricea clavata]